MLGVSLAPGAAPAKAWWPAGAVYAADFVNGRYMRNGNAVTAEEAFSVSRATGRWAVDSTGLWRHFGPNVPAITDLGLSVEPAGTNLVPNPALTGAVAGIVGSGGSLPTGWSTNGSGLVVHVVAVTTLNGLPALHLRVFGTATSTFFELSLMSDTSISASTGYTASIFLRSLAGSMPSVELRQADAGSGFVTANVLSTMLAPLDRRGASFTSQASTAFGRLRVSHFLTVGSSYDFSILLSCPQMEARNSATSAVLTTRDVETADIGLPAGSGLVYLMTHNGSVLNTGPASGHWEVPLGTTRLVWMLPS